jgi:hypothetical protein
MGCRLNSHGNGPSDPIRCFAEQLSISQEGLRSVDLVNLSFHTDEINKKEGGNIIST